MWRTHCDYCTDSLHVRYFLVDQAADLVLCASCYFIEMAQRNRQLVEPRPRQARQGLGGTGGNTSKRARELVPA